MMPSGWPTRLTDAMQSRQVELIGGLGDHRVHRRSLYCLGIASASRKSFFWPLGGKVDVPRGISRASSKRLELQLRMWHTTQASMPIKHADILAKPSRPDQRPLLRSTIAPRPSSPTTWTSSYRYQCRLRQSHSGCRSHGVLLVLVPLASLSLTGRDGRAHPIMRHHQVFMSQCRRSRFQPYQNSGLS